MSTYFVGIDPDLHTTAIAVADLHEVYHIEVVRSSNNLKGHDAVLDQIQRLAMALPRLLEHPLYDPATLVVESQRIYERHQKANPNSLLPVAQVAGGAVGVCEGRWANLVLPQDWKQQQPKEVNQARTYEHYGWDHKKAKGYVVPTNHGFTNVKDSDWKHLGDALGIALWAAKEAETKAKREKWKAKK